MKIVQLDDVVPQRWRNGGGTTRELYAWPDGAEWKLRISAAQIDHDGPFSAFPGVTRHFVVVEGAGVQLDLPGGAQEVLAGQPPITFDGADAPHCRLIDGPALDLNLMVVAAAGQGRLMLAEPGQEWAADAPLRAVFTLDDATLHVGGAGALALPAASLALNTGAAFERWSLHARGSLLRAWWLAFQPACFDPAA